MKHVRVASLLRQRQPHLHIACCPVLCTLSVACCVPASAGAVSPRGRARVASNGRTVLIPTRQRTYHNTCADASIRECAVSALTLFGSASMSTAAWRHC